METTTKRIKTARVMLLSRMANGDDLLPLYDSTSEEIACLAPVKKMLSKLKRASRGNKIRRKKFTNE